MVAGKRSKTTCSGVEARVLSTLLNEMDGVGVSANIYEAKSEKKKEELECEEKSGEKKMEREDGSLASEDNVLVKEQITGLPGCERDSLNDESPGKGCSLKEQEIEKPEPRSRAFKNDFQDESISGDKPAPGSSIKASDHQIRNLITKDVLLVAATNRPGAIDEALLRPGRIDRMIYVPPPDTEARLEILRVHCRRCPIADDVDLGSIAVKTEMFSGADLENLCREVLRLVLLLGVIKSVYPPFYKVQQKPHC